ncbi:hypothetical protein [Nocardia uniformis]|uniref:hypothetical protein n=1 Tax=Nocardia uniformis TaxID=53432 RepID=UPI00147961D1|nr:hypothetical protein [Nocardia uniformis]
MREYMSSPGTVTPMQAAPIVERDDTEWGPAHDEDGGARHGRAFGTVAGDSPDGSSDEGDNRPCDQTELEQGQDHGNPSILK